MSIVARESMPARVAASQANGKKLKGPIAPERKARASHNPLKTGAYQDRQSSMLSDAEKEARTRTISNQSVHLGSSFLPLGGRLRYAGGESVARDPATGLKRRLTGALRRKMKKKGQSNLTSYL
jgi:hypothetical protein